MKLAMNPDHSVLRYTIRFQALAGLLCIVLVTSLEAILQVCVNNATSSSRVNIMCGDSDRIEVVYIYYDYRQTFSKTCEAPTGNNKCSKIFKTGPELRSKILYYQCSQSQACDATVGTIFDIGCPNVTPNFVLMEYNCVPATDFIDLCGDDAIIISAIKHLAYFKRVGDPKLQNCTCLIRGSHTLTAVHTGIPTTTDCSLENLVINWEPTINPGNNRTLKSGQESMINVDFKELRSSRITLVKTCKSLWPPVWFKMKPDNDATVQIQCGLSITTESTTSTSPLTSPLNTDLTTGGTASFSPGRETSTKVPVIVGYVVGGLVLICIIVVLIVIVLRRKQTLLRRENPKKTAPNKTSEHDDFLEKPAPSYVNVKADSDINHRNEHVNNGLEGMNCTNYEDVASYNGIDNPRGVHEYDNTSGSLDMRGSRQDHTTNPLKGTGNTYENTNVTGYTSQIYVNEVFDDQQYSTLDHSEDNPGHYEQLKVQ